MAAARGGVNFVKFYFYAGNSITAARKEKLVALAYSTARDQKLAPKEVLIRSDVHDTTTIDGKRGKDPKGWHATFAYKDSDLVEREFHVASHGYTDGKEKFTLTDATHAPEKKDNTPRGGKKSGKVVWPDKKGALEEYVNNPIAYSHLPEQ
ncbi:hypothetical protein FQN54_003525 [Arachnomyces sp. PD_36]|nr:hypothetical protein FQN54_003525 [Arachnomyces sp. PD_36]